MPRLVPPVIEPGTFAATPQPTIQVDGSIVLRPWSRDDVDALLAAFSDPAIQRWHHLRLDSRGEAEAWVDAAASGWDPETAATWAIADAGDDRVLGRIGLHLHDLRQGLGEISYWVVPEARGRGLAPRAVVAASAWALAPGRLHRLELAHSVDNVASCRVAAKAGFEPEGHRRSALRHDDGWHDLHLHVRIAPD